ncbi:hypothetical protein KAFR_0A07730 [Kazachstania africana CBS 2517]|uniref:Serine/threonine-protein phosphatase 4 regulatory subunit 3 n=1 Tax=Kazachstania africana (strain ATCC 22294 / BCRC 22015 / CBS 2517 / CECT 1963 / NBRC 1671 / NRRL Y-8276) TaxID=1071382 RepID=H2APA7_KAZAF|nr:hypothetical protein KAFR_0A07730 [Kazachstania africana CBS 2517]CCF56207.1 hypothetical protein KAFR_0A07730 [Kazachstania africana CBS 2517]
MTSTNTNNQNNVDESFSNTEPKRVKVYVLENNEWKDNGTGFCTGEIRDVEEGDEITKSAYLVVSSEDDQKETLLRSKVEGNIEYQRQEETLIVWKDLNGNDIALSFEESIGCDTLCEFIIQVQRHIENSISLISVKSSDNGIGSVHEIVAGPVILPSTDKDQNTDTLYDALKIVNENSIYDYMKNETIEFILQSSYINLLIDHFHRAEKGKMIKDLFLLSTIIKTLILYNQRDIIELMVDDEHIMGIIGILEYDTEFPNLKANHREYLKLNGPCFKEVIPLENKDLELVVKKYFRLKFLKDVVLVRFLDDNNLNSFMDIILDLKTCIIDWLQTDPFLDKIMNIFSTDDDSSKKRDAIRLLHQYVGMSKDLDPIDKTKFYRTLVRKGLFNVLSYAFSQEKDSNLRILATDLIITIIEHDILLIHNIQNEKTKDTAIDDNFPPASDAITDDMKLLSILSTILLSDKSPGLMEQVVQALSTLLHPDGCLAGTDGEFSNFSSISSINGFDVNDSDNSYGMDGIFNSIDRDNNETEANKQLKIYFNKFYSQIAPFLFKPLMPKANIDCSELDDFLLIHLLKLISFIATEHTRLISRKFILENGILKTLSQLIGPTHILQLRLTAVRCFKNILNLNDKYYHRYIISNNLVDPIFELLKDNLFEDNLATSCILDLLNIVSLNCTLDSGKENDQNAKHNLTEKSKSLNKAKNNFTILNKHIIGKYGSIIKELSSFPFIREMFEFDRITNEIEKELDIETDIDRISPNDTDTNKSDATTENCKRSYSELETSENSNSNEDVSKFELDQHVVTS